MRKYSALLPLLALAALPARASDLSYTAIGTTGSEFLTLDAGARGIAMGGAYSAVTDDAYSMYWNPAGLTRIPRLSSAYMYNQYVAGISYDYLAYAQRLTETSVVGGAVRYLDFGSIPQTDVSGNSAGSFHPRDGVYELGYGQYITDLADFERDVSMGVALRYLQSDMIAHASGIAGDLGIQIHYTDVYFPYDLGAVFQNFGQGEKFDQVRDTLPFRARVGGAVHWNPSFLTSAEIVLPISNQPYGSLGAEWTVPVKDNFKAFLRTGFESQTVASGLNTFSGIRFGLGLTAANVTFDFAFAPMGVLGNTELFSLSFNLPKKTSQDYRER